MSSSAGSPTRESRFFLSMLVFWLLAVIVLFNLNELTRMLWGVTRVFSFLGLFCCAFLACLAVRVPWRQALGIPGVLILVSWTSYILIGLIVALAGGVHFDPDLRHYVLSCANSVMIIIAAAFGGAVVLRRIGSERLLKTIMLLLAANCILTLMTPILLELYQFQPRYGIFYYRLSGVFFNANEAGLIGCLAVVSALSLLNTGRQLKLACLILLLGTVVVVASFSRMAIFILGLIFVLFMAQRYRLDARSIVVRLVIMGIIGAGVLAVIHYERFPLRKRQSERIATVINLFRGDFEDPMLRAEFRFGRLYLWDLALQRILQAPFAGNGVGEMYRLEAAPHPEMRTYRSRGRGVHNTYLLIIGDAGIIPLALFLLFFGSLLWLRWVLPKTPVINVVSGWTLILIVYCLASHSVMLKGWPVFIIGLSCALLGREIQITSQRKELAALTSSRV